MEATSSGTLNALAGINLILDPGFLEGALTGSLEMLLITNEAAGMVKRFLKGIPVNKETLAEDIITQVGPGGHFLEELHTYESFKQNMWVSELLDRNSYARWRENGGRDMGERIKEEIRHILSSHHPKPLPKEVLAKIRTIRERSEKQRF